MRVPPQACRRHRATVRNRQLFVAGSEHLINGVTVFFDAREIDVSGRATEQHVVVQHQTLCSRTTEQDFKPVLIRSDAQRVDLAEVISLIDGGTVAAGRLYCDVSKNVLAKAACRQYRHVVAHPGAGRRDRQHELQQH